MKNRLLTRLYRRPHRCRRFHFLLIVVFVFFVILAPIFKYATILVQAKKQLSTTKYILRIHYVAQNKIVKKLFYVSRT